ncbi:DUF397 domain-containing protein [Streptomyces sp. WMMB 322]|uniref:DUF397 domain-containing protein n=1 Tax=Streptomyces sp. WMMB 322 TaxID=1286821 RepID=UPI0006E30A37|nr:DUF397 domain-containing protein [Streptomyces sp. WMMB 322]SCK52382.1 protein of unknown function [Streptomyces sp. WMMB 322]
MNTTLKWLKSSYSDNEGGACVEVALSWHKSSHSSGEGGNCVEVSNCPGTVHVRDSKKVHGPRLAFKSEVWTDFLTHTIGR